MIASVEFKHDDDERWFIDADFRARRLLWNGQVFMGAHGYEKLIVTSLITEDPNRTTRTHAELRAIDVRVKPIPLELWEEWAEIENDFWQLPGDMQAVVVGRFDKDGRHNDHAHLQVPRPYRGSGKVIL